MRELASVAFNPRLTTRALCNTLLITILISILSNEFAAINANAQEEVSRSTVPRQP